MHALDLRVCWCFSDTLVLVLVLVVVGVLVLALCSLVVVQVVVPVCWLWGLCLRFVVPMWSGRRYAFMAVSVTAMVAGSVRCTSC